MIRRGDVFLAQFGPVAGREQAGRRPVVIVSADAVNDRPLVVMVVPGTGAEHVARDYASNVRVTAAESGLPKDTVFLCFHARAVDPVRFVRAPSGDPLRLGRLPPTRMAEVDAALRRVLAL